MSKKYDAAVRVGEYQDRNGETKGRYVNVGAVIQGDKGPYLLLNRTFNPAGVPNPDNRDNVIVSLFEPRQSDSQQSAPTPPADDVGDTDIPF